jgi:hypothetical protein
MNFISIAGAVSAIFAILLFAGFRATARTRPERTESSPESVGVDCILYGALLIKDGFDYLPDWRSTMLREFDDSIKPHLDDYYRLAKTLASQPQDQWQTLAQSQISSCHLRGVHSRGEDPFRS